jgi:CRISPR-associated endonuclease/helicase Cas3
LKDAALVKDRLSHRQEQNTLLSPDGVAECLAHLEGNREQLLRDHLFAVSEAARSHADKIGIGAAGAAIGLLHDFGKYSRSFQEYLRRMSLDQDTEEPDPERGKIDHSTAGAQTIWRTLKQQGTLQGVVGELLAICVASHHSGLIDCITPGGFDNLSRRMKKADPESHFEEVRAAADESVTLAYTQCLQDPKLVSSIRDLIVKIGQRDGNTGIRQFKIGLLVRFLFSCLIDADRTDTADFSNGRAASLRQYGRYAGWPAFEMQEA